MRRIFFPVLALAVETALHGDIAMMMSSTRLTTEETPPVSEKVNAKARPCSSAPSSQHTADGTPPGSEYESVNAVQRFLTP